MKRIHQNTSEHASAAELEYRDRLDLLRKRIGLLAGEDRALMTMYLENGSSLRQLARVAGVCESSMHRRIRKLTNRLIAGSYVTCLRKRRQFTRLDMIIARDYFLKGISMRKIAARRCLTYYNIRKTLKKIQGIITAAQQDDLDPGADVEETSRELHVLYHY